MKKTEVYPNEMLAPRTLSRYDVTYYTFRQLQRDHIRFKGKYTEKFQGEYICNILKNYMCYAQDNFMEQFEADVTRCFEKGLHDEYVKNGRGRISFAKPLINKLREFDFITHPKFKKHTLINFILDQFARLPLSEREKIYCYPQYCIINDVIEKGEIIHVDMMSGKKFDVKPYNIEVDENTLSYYLMGYSRYSGSNDEFEYYSIKLSRIENCWSEHKPSCLSAKDIRTARKINEKFGSAYIVNNLTEYEIKETVVMLTKKGYLNLYLKIISRQRPLPIKEPELTKKDGKEYYKLTFDCSHQQIRNYFFSFGNEAEIISPDSLRNQFITDYEKAIKRYQTE